MKSVFHLFYRPRYYLKHPLRFLKEVFSNLQDAWHRARYGWTYSDVWNFNSWFLEVIPDMLDYLAENEYGYPGNDEFPTYESWKAWLRKQAAAIRSCSEEEQNNRNEFKNDYYAALDKVHLGSKPDPEHSDLRIVTFENEPPELDELFRKYTARAAEIDKECNEILTNALIELAHQMPTLWD